MNRVLKFSKFHKWMRKCGLTDDLLRQAAEEMMKGLIDVDLGCGLVKKRVALSGMGKRGGTRTIVATNKRDRWIFLHGFEKNEQSNISTGELQALKDLSRDYLKLTAQEMNVLIRDKELMEVI